MKRREFLAGTLPLALNLSGPAALASTGAAPHVCLVADGNGRPPDVAGVFEELGIRYDAVPQRMRSVGESRFRNMP